MSELTSAIKQICEEKGLDEKSVITTIESALAAAYRKDFGEKNQNIKVEFDPATGKSKVFDVKTVVEDMPKEEEEKKDEKKKENRDEKKEVKANEKTETELEKESLPSAMDEIEEANPVRKNGAFPPEADRPLAENSDLSENKEAGLYSSPLQGAGLSNGVKEEKKFNPKTEIQLSDAKLIKKTAKVGGEIKTKLEIPAAYGRMAAQTAKQVIVQRLREAEREMIFSEFKGKEKEVVSGVVQRREGRFVLIDLGKAVGYLSPEEQIFGEQYKPGERIKVYIKEVKLGSRGPEIILSRTSEEILKKVFYLEIPEISNGLVELKAVAREAGSRSKVAVWTNSENVDPIGSCVGQRGARIQTVISELGGEKIDIIEYDENTNKFVANALSPAKILSVETNEKEKKTTVKVLSDQLSLAIGKNGQNARLAAKLTGWRINIVEVKKEEEKNNENKESEKEEKSEEKEKAKRKKKETQKKAEKKEEKTET